MQFQDAVQQFLKHLELERGCTPCTVSAYTSDSRIFLRYLQETGIEPDSDSVTPLVMRRYVSWLAGSGARPASVQRRVAAVSSMWKWLVGYEYAIMNPCAGLVLPKKGRRMPAVLTTEEARRVLTASEDHPNVEFRPQVDHDYLFSGIGGKRLGKNGLIGIFNRVGERLASCARASRCTRCAIPLLRCWCSTGAT
jgi:site-specific recombinase XerD